MKPFKYNPNSHSGRYRHRIVFQEYSSEGTDSDGFPVKGWQDVKVAWAMIKTLKGTEYFSASSTQNENQMRFIIHFTEGLNEDMIILHDNREFDIESILNDDEENRTLTIIGNEKR